MTPVSEGDILAGRYRVDRVLGVGGMGVVVAAVHVQLGQRVAVKFLRPETCQHPGIGVRFLREARAAARIQSEHVGRVIDFGTLENGAPYMVMEFLSGADLSQMAHSGQPFPIDQAVEYILQACEGIAEAHALGIVHRDVKPANLFVTRRSDGSPLLKVLDFGISKAKDEEVGVQSNVSMTATGAVLGSPAYMSPEQVRSAKDIDGRADIWALGVVLHELLAGRPVYQADTLSALLAMIAADPPVPLRVFRADVPTELERIVLRCLSKDRDQRFADVGELAQALKPFGPARAALHADRARSVLRASRPSLSEAGDIAVSARTHQTGHGDSVPASVVSQQLGTSKRRRLALFGAAVALVLVIAAFVLVNTSRKRLDGLPTASVAAATAADAQAIPSVLVVEKSTTDVASASVASASKEGVPSVEASTRGEGSRAVVPAVQEGDVTSTVHQGDVTTRGNVPTSTSRGSKTNVSASAKRNGRDSATSAAAPTAARSTTQPIDRGANPF